MPIADCSKSNARRQTASGHVIVSSTIPEVDPGFRLSLILASSDSAVLALSGPSATDLLDDTREFQSDTPGQSSELFIPCRIGSPARM